MLKFSSNLKMLFNEHPFLNRFQQAANDGFKNVEFLFPYDYPATLLASIIEKIVFQYRFLTLILETEVNVKGEGQPSSM